ncbi:MAG TPA: hypothetical protein DD666_16800 [Advenella kashmirensis]|uniref:Uncharacterized protein n=2 Tax=Advenella TaxID=290425 RepID=A0A356LJ97_9BURK|nr:hypothetical protein [Advenella kashmirensis]
MGLRRSPAHQIRGFMERNSIAASVTLLHTLPAMSVAPEMTKQRVEQIAPELLTVVGQLVMDPDINN